MNWYISIPCVLILGIIAFQDFKERAIYWFWLPILFLLFGFYSYTVNGLRHTVIFFIANSAYAVFILLAGILLISFRRKIHFTKLINTYIGAGDILFLIAIVPFFSLFNYAVFFICSMFLAILSHGIYSSINSRASEKNPLAGIAALALAACIVYKHVNAIDFYDDSVILNLLAFNP